MTHATLAMTQLFRQAADRHGYLPQLADMFGRSNEKLANRRRGLQSPNGDEVRLKVRAEVDVTSEAAENSITKSVKSDEPEN